MRTCAHAQSTPCHCCPHKPPILIGVLSPLFKCVRRRLVRGQHTIPHITHITYQFPQNEQSKLNTDCDKCNKKRYDGIDAIFAVRVWMERRWDRRCIILCYLSIVPLKIWKPHNQLCRKLTSDSRDTTKSPWNKTIASSPLLLPPPPDTEEENVGVLKEEVGEEERTTIYD